MSSFRYRSCASAASPARRRLAALLGVAMLWSAGSARAQSTASKTETSASTRGITEARAHARALADEAANAYAAGEYQQSHELLSRAFAYLPAPTISLLDARTLLRLGRWMEARNAYLRTAGWQLGSDASPVFRKAREDAAVEVAALEPRIPTLRVALPAGMTSDTARVFLDERLLTPDQLDQPQMLDPGLHRVRLEVDGRRLADEQLSLGEGERRTYRLESRRRESVAPHPHAPADSRRSWGWLSLGVGGLGLAAGGITGAIAMHAHARAEDECIDHRCVEGSSGADALERFRTFRTVSTVGYAVGISGVGLGALLLLTNSSGTGARVGIAPSWNGLHVVGAL